MSGPKRLIEEGSAFDQALLRAGREDRPSSDYERRVLVAASMLPATALAGSARPSLLSRLVRPQFLAVIVAIGAGTAFVSSTSSQQRAQDGQDGQLATQAAAPTAEPRVEPATVSVTPVTSVVSTDAKPSSDERVVTPAALPQVSARALSRVSVTAAPPVPTALSERSSRAVAAAPATAGVSLQREVELLDSVKRSLRSAAHADAQRALDSYDSEFPSGTLKPEAGFLRIRLLLARGDRAKARALGDELRARYPNSVHARRIEAALAADAANDRQDQASPR